MARYLADGSGAVEPTALAVGDRVRFDRDPEWWTVQAVSRHFTACVRPLTGADREEYRQEREDVGDYLDSVGDDDGPLYTVLDWRNGVRGPCDLIGQAWGDGTYSPAECVELLAAFEVTDDDIRAAIAEHNDSPPGEPPSAPSHLVPTSVSVSQRNWVPLRIIEHKPATPEE